MLAGPTLRLSDSCRGPKQGERLHVPRPEPSLQLKSMLTSSRFITGGADSLTDQFHVRISCCAHLFLGPCCHRTPVSHFHVKRCDIASRFTTQNRSRLFHGRFWRKHVAFRNRKTPFINNSLTLADRKRPPTATAPGGCEQGVFLGNTPWCEHSVPVGGVRGFRWLEISSVT